MYKSLAIVITLLFAVICGFSQTSPGTAPTKWEKYALPGESATVLLPKMPIVITRSSVCAGEKRSDYGAYSDGVAYVISTVDRINPSSYCPNPKKFDENSFTDRVFELEARLKDAKISDTEVDGRKWVQVRTKTVVYFLYNDFAHKRWFEFWATGADDGKAEVKKFLTSLELDDPKGLSIGEGSSLLLGDEETKETPVVITIAAENPNGKISVPIGDSTRTAGVGSGAMPAPRAPGSEPAAAAGSEPAAVVKIDDTYRPVMTVLRSLPPYTEAGRQARVNGIVRLRVTFLNNGKVGPITVVTALPMGLTEQAIASARKMLFVPAKKDNAFISVARIVEYNFSIY